jgi:lysophospholipase L1-like esterase
VPAVGSIPPGAGPFTTSNYYSLGAGSDVMDFASSFSVIVIGKLTSIPDPYATAILDSNLSTSGWVSQITPTGNLAQFYAWPNLHLGVVGGISFGPIFVLCAGMASGIGYTKLSGATTLAKVLTYTQDSTGVVRIGSMASSNRWNGTIYEIMATSTPASENFFSQIINQVGKRLKISLGSSVSLAPLGAGSVSCLGDSITLGSGVTTPWPTTLGTNLGGGYPVTNNGVNGANSTAQLTTWAATVKPTGKKWMTIEAGVVDAIQDVPSAVTISNLQTIYEDAMRSGVRIIPITCLPFGNYTLWSAPRQALLDTTNAWIRSYCGNSIPYVEAYNSALNDGSGKLAAGYDSGDGLHPNQSGADFIESIVRPKFT